jgi:hypothetical protein
MMTCTMKRSAVRILARLVFVLVVLLTPLASRASSDESQKDPYDARLQNYPQNVVLDGGGTALSYLLLIVLAALCLGVMFKNANRSHLD